jgi:innexin
VREFGHPRLSHEYTVPCVLPLNLFNQQMFTLLYFWYAIVILMNIGDFFLWLYTISSRNRRAFIRKRLHSKKYPLTNETKHREKIRRFTDEYLEADGFFILTLIKENSSDFVASEIIHRLYTDKYLKRHVNDTTMTSSIYDAIDMKQDDESISSIKRRHHLCSMIC